MDKFIEKYSLYIIFVLGIVFISVMALNVYDALNKERNRKIRDIFAKSVVDMDSLIITEPSY